MRANLDLLLDWAHAAGLGELASEHTHTLASAINVLATPRNNLLQVQITHTHTHTHTQDTFSRVGFTISNHQTQNRLRGGFLQSGRKKMISVSNLEYFCVILLTLKVKSKTNKTVWVWFLTV